ncbi:anthranilate synthase component I family protein [Luteibaculum oceani]|uniref:Anthranilate synthase component I family protein n=1 Tax=Luteibaculum oceani TaxID=1294296 RepID=A0A5C6V8P6_9FLAO|nr:anthranilate synthase component I family protein [Luteibaculum oceani]TXC81773.1 anthranilate synthase component I family protein [Luteibaculum oceani]
MMEPFENFDFWAFFNSNGEGAHPVFAGVKSSLEINPTQGVDWIAFQNFLDRNKGEYIFCAFSYELKNDIEELTPASNPHYSFPKLLLIVPEHIGEVQPDTNLIDWEEGTLPSDVLLKKRISDLLKNPLNKKRNVYASFSRNEYVDRAKMLLENIRLGNIYEVNFCQEFICPDVDINSWDLYQSLNEKTQAPYSAFVKYKGNRLLCASPELFLRKEDGILRSSPIKGTVRRSKNAAEDLELSIALAKSEKERAENIMIVDLVRNDFSRIAKKGSVEVEELCAIKSFKTVHHMVSTVKAEIEQETDLAKILKATFPMGSMTGAPKISAMELAQQAEGTPRGIYSGSIGYILPNGDFNFNVVIRSLFYDTERKELNFKTGSALTAKCDPEMEYDECLVKAKALIDSVNGQLVTKSKI